MLNDRYNIKSIHQHQIQITDNYTMEELLDYSYYHQNPINKGIHAVCIPLIVLTLINFVDEVKITDTCGGRKTVVFTLKHVMFFVWLGYYLTLGIDVCVAMAIYLVILMCVSKLWKTVDPHWQLHSSVIHVVAWLLQFMGHAIEGRRPALVDSITTSIFEAPMFSLGYVTDIFR